MGARPRCFTGLACYSLQPCDIEIGSTVPLIIWQIITAAKTGWTATSKQFMKKSSQVPLQILLADDDADDTYFFAKALAEISLPVVLDTVENGERLILRL